MAEEHDSWLKSAFGLDVSAILTSTPEDGAAAPGFSSGAAANSLASGFKKQAEGAVEVLASAGRALGDVEEAKLDAAKGVAIKAISGVAGATAGVASAAGDETFADELRAAQASADADAGRHFDRAGQKLDEARQELTGDDPPPTERPDPPEGGGPPTDRPPPPTERPDRPEGGGPPTERGPFPRAEGDDPPPTERPDPPEGGGPPTDRPPPPTERPDRPEGGGPPTERQPIPRTEVDDTPTQQPSGLDAEHESQQPE